MKFKRYRKGTKYLSVPVFDKRVYLATEPEQLEVFQTSAKECQGYTVRLVHDESEDKAVLVCIFDTNPRVITHECIHAAYEIMEQCGIPTCRNNEEVLAYLSDFLFDCIYKELNR